MNKNLIQNIERMSRDSRWSQESFKKVKLTLEELNKIAHDECSKFKDLLGDDFDQAVINIRDLLANDGARTVGKSISAVDDSYKPWVKSRIANTETPHWNKYKVELQRDYPAKVAQSTDDNTTEILDMLGNPKEGSFNKRGLVMGSVQMGKTLNYIGLISKAADFGYKFIIIIAGATNNLRTQTQSRVDEGFTRVDSGSSQIMTPEIYGNQPMSLTNLVNDFNKVKKGDDFNLLQSDRPYIAVVKKNGTVLKNLLNWIVDAHFLEGHSKSNPTQGGPLDIPLLLIDDEADYASVNTAKDPKKITKINETIRQILSKFSKSSYLGYTATPFANIFIDPYKDINDEVGDDLFPKNFIYKLGLPNNYMGPDTFFGDKANDLLTIDLAIDHPKTMDYHIVKDRSDKDNPVFQVNGITDDLKAAIRNFILIVVERKLRGHLNKHNTMMINFQYLTILQELLKGHVKSYLDELTDSCVAWNSLPIDRALEDPNIKDLFDTYKKEFTDKGITHNGYLRNFKEILKNLKLIETIELITVHFKSNDRLNYDDYENGKNVIAIGGFSLSRGLTLEGLSVSFLDRNTKNSDTLLQMGRWFGYRDGYSDISRLYIDWQSKEFFEQSTETINELYGELDYIHKYGLTPMDFGLKVRQHPGALRITAMNKMRSADIRSWSISYWGSKYQSVNLFNNTDINNSNLTATKNLICNLPKNYKKVGQYYLWNSVSTEDINVFFESFQEAPRKDNAQIHVRVFVKELKSYFKHWDVLLLSNRAPSKEAAKIRKEDAIKPLLFNDIKVNPMLRAFIKDKKDNNISVRKNQLGGSNIEEYLLSEDEKSKYDIKYKELKEQYENEDDIATPRKMTILREIKSRPSLIIHPLIASNFNKDEVCNPDLNVHIGFSISFPKFMEDGTTPLTSDKKYALTALKQRELDFNPEEIEEETEDE